MAKKVLFRTPCDEPFKVLPKNNPDYFGDSKTKPKKAMKE